MKKQQPLRPAAKPSARDDGGEDKGLVCSRCGCRHFFVHETRQTVGGLRRRRSCRHCGRMLTTIEKPRDDAPKAS